MHIIQLYIMLQIYSVENSKPGLLRIGGEFLKEAFTIRTYGSIAHYPQFEHSGDSAMQSYNV